MSSAATRGLGPPSSTHNSKSFSRIEPKRSSPLRSRSSTLSHGEDLAVDAPSAVDVMTEVSSRLESEDVFDKGSSMRQGAEENAQALSHGFDDLPIELISLIGRYVNILHSFKDVHEQRRIDSTSP